MLEDSPSPNSAPISSKTDVSPFSVTPPTMPRLRRMFDDARTQSNPNRLLAQRDRDYYDGPKQLNSEVRTVLNMRGQPAIYTNRVRPMIDGLLGVLETGKTDPRCYPRNPTPEDENASDVATKALRYIADCNDFQSTILDCAENFFIDGIEAAIVEAEGDKVPITQIRYEEFFYDPFSRRPDFKDAKYLGIAQWKDEADVRAAFPEQWKALGDPIDAGLTGPNGALDSTWQDRPDNIAMWVDKARRRLMVVEVYYNEGGKWFHCIYCASGVFVHEESPYKDVITGETLCPIEAESCYVDRENNRYGRIRDCVPIQDEINARRSRLLHLANSRQIQERETGAAMVDSETARKEAARADGVIPSGWQLVPTVDLANGQAQLLAESKSEIDRMGPTPGVLAQTGGADQSGRAKQVIQQAGMTELARPFGRHASFQQRIYQAAWKRAQQFWQGPMWIRVTDETKAPEFLQINEPVMGMVMEPVIDPATMQPAIDQMTGQPVLNPAIGVVGTQNRIAEMDMDIIVSSTPDTTNLQQEIFAELMGIVERVGLQAVFSPEFELIVEMSALQDKQRILERIKGARDENQNSEAMQMIQQLQAQVAELMEGKTAAETAKVISETQENEAQIEQIQAETVRILTEPFRQPVGLGEE